MNIQAMHKEDAFDMDIYRQKLAREGKLQELIQTYSGNYPELGDISTSEKWDGLANMGSVPEIRVKRLAKVVSLIDISKKILDIGVGWGDIIPIFHRYKQDINYTGIDFSAELINRLRERYPKQKFINTSVETLNESYDYVLVLEVLEHVVPSKVFNFLKGIEKALKDDGTLIVTVPLNENLKNNTFVCGKCGSYVNRMGHVRSYSLELIKAELKLAGFLTGYAEFIYEGYYEFKGTIKRHMHNIAGYLLGPSGYRQIMPAGVILKCRKIVKGENVN